MAGLNIWLVGAIALLLGLAPCGYVCVRGGRMERLVGMEMGAMVSAMALLLLARGFYRPSFADLALTLSLVSLPGTLLYVHFMERWR